MKTLHNPEVGWGQMVWTAGYTLLHWSARSGRAELTEYFQSLPPRGAERNWRREKSV